ncbi:MAG: matrixin family metalloprotease, partial [Akkermansiaceae bacterium]|nr:matrixin family metalloprotease [Akkermansiaceae bacterium]
MALLSGVCLSVQSQKPASSVKQQLFTVSPKSHQVDQDQLSPEGKEIRLAAAAVKQIALEKILVDEHLFSSVPKESRQRLKDYAIRLATVESAPSACFAPDTPLEIVRAHHQVEQSIDRALSTAGLPARQLDSRWTSTATDGAGQNIQGLPVTLRWSIVPDGTPISGGFGEPAAPSNLRARLAAIYGGTTTGLASAQPWFPLFQEGFNNIAANTGLKFVYEPNDDAIGITSGNAVTTQGVINVRGDIRISGHNIDGNSNILAYAYYPRFGGDIVFDTADNFFSVTSNNSIRFINVLEHEIGHSLGLDHVCPINQTKLMEPFVNTNFRGSQFDDIYSHQQNYGDSLEFHNASRNNDTSVNAAPLVVVANTLFSKEWLSIDSGIDTDFFLLPATANQLLTVRVIPSDPVGQGGSYLEGPQNPDGSCSGGTLFNPTNQNDLILDVLSANGTTVIASATVQPAGITEQISSFRFPGTGNFFIRVRGGAAASVAQLYRLEVFLGDAVQIDLASTRLDAESNSGQNQSPDPGETIRFGITLVNRGSLPASNLRATLAGPSGTRMFSSMANYGNLAVGASAEGLFTFAIPSRLVPGESANFTLNVLDDNGFSAALPFPISIGTKPGSLILQDFDFQGTVPSGWSQSVVGAGAAWAISTTVANSPNNSAFAPSVAAVGDAFLVSPTVTVR